MNNGFMKFFKSNYSVLITIFVFIILELPHLDTSRSIFVDEAWYSNPSYNFVHSHSFVNTNIGYGGNGLSVYSVYLVVFFYLFGTSIFIARFSSFVMGIVAIILLRKALKILKVSEFNSFVTLSFFMYGNIYLSVFKFTRPEALSFVLSICLLLSLYHYIVNNYSIRYLLLMMLLMFLMVNTHPFSSVIIVLLFIIIPYFIFKNSHYKKLLHVSLLGVWGLFSVFFLLYLIALNNNIVISESVSFLSQRSTINMSVLGHMYAKIYGTYEYFLSTKRVVTFLPYLLVLIAGLFYYRKNFLLFSISLFGFISLTFALLTISSLAFYNVYPYIFLFSVLALPLLLDTVKEKLALKRITGIFVVIAIVLNVSAFCLFSKENYDPDINKKTEKINALIPQNATIVSGPAFWFISPDKHIKAWEYYKNKNEVLNEKEFYLINNDRFSRVNESDGNSIVLLKYNKENYKMDTLISLYSKIYGNINLIKFTAFN